MAPTDPATATTVAARHALPGATGRKGGVDPGVPPARICGVGHFTTRAAGSKRDCAVAGCPVVHRGAIASAFDNFLGGLNVYNNTAGTFQSHWPHCSRAPRVRSTIPPLSLSAPVSLPRSMSRIFSLQYTGARVPCHSQCQRLGHRVPACYPLCVIYTSGPTARIEVRYHAPIPLTGATVVYLDCRVDRVERGTKVWMSAEMRLDGAAGPVMATVEGLWIRKIPLFDHCWMVQCMPCKRALRAVSATVSRRHMLLLLFFVVFWMYVMHRLSLTVSDCLCCVERSGEHMRKYSRPIAFLAIFLLRPTKG